MQLAIIAAGFTPGEADQLRRCMAAWNRKGGLEVFEKKLLDGMLKRGYEMSFARQIFKQIKGFGEYGFPESHSASFALLAYISSWLKYYHPAAFTCALLNSQPMGFYAPAQLVQDARKHNVNILAIDVNHSDYDCTLEVDPQQTENQPCLRLGLRMVKSLAKINAENLVAERKRGAYTTIQELAVRTGLDQGSLKSLADANAFASICPDRHRSHWQLLDSKNSSKLFPESNDDAVDIMLPRPSEQQSIFADYASTGLSLGRHPLALLRPQLSEMAALKAEELWQLKTGESALAAGIVTSRQRPGTASGVMFFTLEDESGFINTVIWSSLIERYRHFITRVKLLLVRGRVQQEDGVLHLVAEELEDKTHWLENMSLKSRDFC